MADVVASQLTRQDKREVVFYRAGIALATLCLLLAAGTLSLFLYADAPKDIKFLSKILDKHFLEKLYLGHFVNFAGAVGLSMIFMHLYARTTLKVMQAIYGVGLITFLAISSFFTTGLWVLASHAGLGLVLVAFSFIAAKEAYCFKYYEGWLVGPLSAVFLYTHVFKLWVPAKYELFTVLALGVVMLLLTIRKMFQSYADDIGDKSGYEG